jgi:hypothetical protein
MNNSKKGVLFFAHNNQHIDYVKQAIFAAQQTKKHLGLPIALVTSNSTHLFKHYSKHINLFDKIIAVDEVDSKQTKIFNDGDQHSVQDLWKNHLRATAYELTPYDETIVLDTDYIVGNKNLLKCFESKEDLLIHRKSVYVNYFNKIDHRVNYISDTGMQMYWATVFYFKKTAKVKVFFEIISHVKENWDYYRFTHQIMEPAFRNDYAFTIAVHMLNGYRHSDWPCPLPDRLYYVTDRDLPESFQEDKWIFSMLTNQGQYVKIKTDSISMHVMNKLALDRIIERGAHNAG